jgi:hypothetical protein
MNYVRMHFFHGSRALLLFTTPFTVAIGNREMRIGIYQITATFRAFHEANSSGN